MAYNSPPASTTTYGVVKVGNGLAASNGVVSFGPAFYGKFSDSTTQLNPVINTANSITFNTSAGANGVSIVAGSQITFANPGVYQIILNGLLFKSDAGNDNVSIWLSQNGVNVPNTCVEIVLVGTTNSGFRSAAFIATTVAANEFVQIQWSSPDILMSFLATPAQVAPTRPAAPSVRIIVSQL